MARIIRDKTYFLLRILQVICAVTVLGQAVCIELVEDNNSDSDWAKTSQKYWLPVMALATGSAIRPLAWLSAANLYDRHRRLELIEVILDFVMAIAWSTVFALLRMNGEPKPEGNLEEVDSPVAKSLIQLCWTFMCINIVVWLTSGTMSSRELWITRGERRREQTRRTFIGNELDEQLRQGSGPGSSASGSRSLGTEDKSRRGYDSARPSLSSSIPGESGSTTVPADFLNIGRGL
ncbi:hypothetical protein LTR05_004988 [Lithohypha guttulata]|uniref:MARVEL domain-containing protein n=1 Tax=Lithohypha guttulata TaxID=1690604 RepID=A0AAN7SZS6_9EURO|nr:hypothetical protein LTR05_004988 [Lithohypha guttulata]